MHCFQKVFQKQHMVCCVFCGQTEVARCQVMICFDIYIGIPQLLCVCLLHTQSRTSQSALAIQ